MTCSSTNLGTPCTAEGFPPSGSACNATLTCTGLTNGATYTCSVTAENSFGTSPAAQTSSLVPNGVPLAPQITSLTAGDRSITVTYENAESFPDQGSVITEYAATCNSRTSGVTGSGNSEDLSPITISSLENGLTYSCVAYAVNANGTSPASAASQTSLPVLTPNAPTSLSATPAGTSVSLAFTAPSNDGGGPVTEYTATCAPGSDGASLTGSGPASPVVVSGLSVGSSYTCIVTASNAFGTGPASNSVSFGPPEAPAVQGVAPTTTSVKIGFSAPAANGSAITSYTATCTPTTGGATGTASGLASPLVVGGLTEGSTYACTVTATNVSGTGPASSASDPFVAEGPDYLFALGSNGTTGCANPVSVFGVSDGCFNDFAPNDKVGTSYPVTDGVNVYWAEDDSGPGKSCPIPDEGSNCTDVFTGPIGDTMVTALAVADGEFFIGQQDGSIWRCPADQPWASGDPRPEGCVEFDDAGKTREADVLLVANGRLYAALNPSPGHSPDSLIWSCSLEYENGCTTLDNPGTNKIYSLAAGAGYLWAGLENGIIWRCDLDTPNECDTWDTGGGGIGALSYGGAGTLYAFVAADPAVSWSCPTGTKNACRAVLSGKTNKNDYGSIAAGANGSGDVFTAGCVADSDSSAPPTSLARPSAAAPAGGAGTAALYSTNYPEGAGLGSGSCTSAEPSSVTTLLLYVPADGPTSPGSAKMEAPLTGAASEIAKRCDFGDRVRAAVQVRGPYGYRRTRRVDLCQVREDGTAVVTFGVLDEGEYSATVVTRSFQGRASFRISDDEVTEVVTDLEPRARQAINSAPGTRLPLRRSIR